MFIPRKIAGRHFYYGLSLLAALGKFKNAMTSLGIEPVTFRLVA
jgi:hypothetical protein